MDTSTGQRGSVLMCGITGHSESGRWATRIPGSLGLAPHVDVNRWRPMYPPSWRVRVSPCRSPSCAHATVYAFVYAVYAWAYVYAHVRSVCLCVCSCPCYRWFTWGIVTQRFTISPSPSSSGRWWGIPWQSYVGALPVLRVCVWCLWRLNLLLSYRRGSSVLSSLQVGLCGN